jgi:hypothetical protein
MATRAAVTIVLLCVGVLLLSACGLPFLMPPIHPPIPSENLVLYRQESSNALVPLGWGSIRGHKEDVRLELTLLPTNCLARERLELAGAITGTPSPTLLLRVQRTDSQTVEMEGILRPQSMKYGIDVLPFHGSLTLNSGCTGSQTIHILATASPDLLGLWEGTTEIEGHTPVQIRETVVPNGSGGPLAIHLNHGFLTLRGEVCSASGNQSGEATFPIGTTQFTLTFLMDDHSTITAATTINPLVRYAARKTRFTVSGGPCDGRTFTADLRP